MAEFKEFERRFNVSRFKPALNITWVLADLNRRSNSLNSISKLKIENPRTHFALYTTVKCTLYIHTVQQ